MSILIEHASPQPFTMVPNGCLCDPRLSWKAKGLFGYLIGRPPGWQLRMADLIARSTDGRDAVLSGIKELEDCGYLVRHQSRNDAGQFVTTKIVLVWNPESCANRVTPETGFPVTVQPCVENPPSNKKEYSNTHQEEECAQGAPPAVPLDSSPSKAEEASKPARIEKPKQAKPDPLADFPVLAAAYPAITSALKTAHPAARLPASGTGEDYRARDTLAKLARLDGAPEQSIVDVLLWVFTARDTNAEFWRANVLSLASLRKCREGDATKFAKVQAAMRRSRGVVRQESNARAIPAGGFSI
jgi:hypothetical protein